MAMSNLARAPSIQCILSWAAVRVRSRSSVRIKELLFEPSLTPRCKRPPHPSASSSAGWLKTDPVAQKGSRLKPATRLSSLGYQASSGVTGGIRKASSSGSLHCASWLGPASNKVCGRASTEAHSQSVRPFSSSQADTDPVMYGLLGALATQAPAFPVRGDDVQVLSTPTEYFEALLDGIAGAKHRIVLASLYLGTDAMEQKLADAVGKAVSANPELEVTLLFDALRGTRPTGGKDGGASSTADLICRSILSQAGSRVKASLYHTPELSGYLKRFLPARYNETVGIMHLKAYIFDDTTLMSGANLSTSYFTDRQVGALVTFDCVAVWQLDHVLSSS
jgi:phosphatidylserine/phosphatidylglycerophosphate/cardiolipin synthase-like enzyme